MSMAQNMPCWAIMNCHDCGECAARQNPEIPCWDLAQELKHVQNVLGVCNDCIVFQIKNNPALFGEKKLAAILAHRKVNGFKRPKCPSILVSSLPRHDNRRRARRFKLNGESLAIVSNRESLSEHKFELVDLSNTGLTCVGPEARNIDKPDLTIEVKINGYHLKSLHGTIISEMAVKDDGSGTKRRYGFRFTDLSSAQRAMLDSLLIEQHQPE